MAQGLVLVRLVEAGDEVVVVWDKVREERAVLVVGVAIARSLFH